MRRTVTALFDTEEAARRAAHGLATRAGGVRGEVYASRRAGELSSLAIPGEDAAALREHVRRGGAVLHAEVPEGRFEAVADALEAAGAAGFEARDRKRVG